MLKTSRNLVYYKPWFGAVDTNNALCYKLLLMQILEAVNSRFDTANVIPNRLQSMKESRRKNVLGAALFKDKQKLSKEALILIFGQYWRALNYFPDFLASAVLAVGTLKEKGAIAKVLAEETGEGSLERSHEYAYFRALESVGLKESEVKASAESPKTKLLTDGYRSGKYDADRALGYFLSTEVADLWIVSSLGRILIQNMNEKKSVEWIDLHITQEPGHVSSAAGCLDGIADTERIERIFAFADECSERWDAFFADIYNSINLIHKQNVESV